MFLSREGCFPVLHEEVQAMFATVLGQDYVSLANMPTTFFSGAVLELEAFDGGDDGFPFLQNYIAPFSFLVRRVLKSSVDKIVRFLIDGLEPFEAASIPRVLRQELELLLALLFEQLLFGYFVPILIEMFDLLQCILNGCRTTRICYPCFR